MSVIEFSEHLEAICKSLPISVPEYKLFWTNLKVRDLYPAHYVVVLISKYLYYTSGQHKSSPFLEFLFRTSSPASLLPTDTKIVPDNQTNIFLISLFFLLFFFFTIFFNLFKQDIINSLYKTIFYVSLFFKVNVTSQLKYAIKNWLYFCEKSRTKVGIVLEVRFF